MHLHHLGGTRAAQEASARFEETAHPPTRATATDYTEITDGKETKVAEVRALLLSPPAPMGFTIPAEIGNYLPLKLKLNIVLEIARGFRGHPLVRS